MRGFFQVLAGTMFGLFSYSYALAAGTATGPTFADVVGKLENFVDAYVVPLLYIIAFLVFLIGMFRYFFTGGDENRQKGKAFVLWGIIGMVVLFALWGIVHLLLSIIPGA